jgi:hypothetical protein
MGNAQRWPNTGQHPLQEAAMVHPLPSRRQCIAALATLPAWGLLPKAHAAPALLLAQTAPGGMDPTGYLVSDKYDGVRAL